MATNVTEKDKTLNEIIDMCVKKRAHYRQFLNDFILTHSEDWHDSADVTYGERIMFLRGKIQAFDECAACCESMLGYSGSMPSEVPNQSEGREMSCQYKVFPVFWTGSGINRCLSNMELFEEALNDGWKIVRMDTIPPLEVPCAALSATNVYILKKENEDVK